MADDDMSPSPPAPTDPRLPLSARQIFKLRQSWKGIKRNLEEAGVEMFIRLFRYSPSHQNLFREFRNIPVEELRLCEALEKHAVLVMGVFNEAITAIDNVDNTQDIMRKAAKNHVHVQGFTPEMYWDMEKPFLEAVQITLGDRYSDNMDNIYRITIKYLLETILNGHRNVAS